MNPNVGGVIVANPALFAQKPTERPVFLGGTFDAPKDEQRLSGQVERVRQAMLDGSWKTLSEIAEITGDPEASVSARLRDLRRARFGFYTVNRRRRTGGYWEYSVSGGIR